MGFISGLNINKSMILCFALAFLSCTNARPDLSLGYRYNQGHSSGGSSFLQAPGSVLTSYAPTAASNSYFASQPSVGQLNKQTGFTGFGQQTGGFDVGFSGGSAFNHDFSGSSQFDSGSLFQSQGVQPSFAAPIVSKHFYVHTAPSDDDEEEIVRHIQVGQPKKNYRVVFINTPSSHSAKAKIIADIAPTEEKTAIYVLAKKNNALDISAEVNTPAPLNSKPEVFFVKYKTPEEAVHAQHTIQAQYDALGGASDISDEGEIPVSSVIGSLQGSHEGSGISASASTSDGSLSPVETTHFGNNAQQTYLPANSKFKY